LDALYYHPLPTGPRQPGKAGYILPDTIIAAFDATEPLSNHERTAMPGLLRGVARTAVVAGTATAVSNRVSRRQANRWSSQEEEQYAQQQQQQQQYAQQQYYQEPPPPPPAAPAVDPIAQLKELADLHSQGILTDDEFVAQKAKLLNS
jgi:hypothetical protein